MIQVGTTRTLSTKSSLNNSGPTIVSVFEVRFTGAFDPVAIYQSAHSFGLPDYGGYVVGTSNQLYCSNVEAEITPGSLWVGSTTHPASCRYTATFSTITEQRLDLSPISRPMIVCGGGIELTEVRRVDINGKAIVNSVGDFYEGLPEFYVGGAELQVSWNVAANPLSKCQQYSFSTNNAAIWGRDAWSGLMGKVTAQEMYETYQGVLIEYWRCTAPIRFRNDGSTWNYQPYDYGYRYKQGTKIITYTDPTTGATGPVFLNGGGGLLNGNGTTSGSPAVIYPTGSGGGPKGYQTYSGQDWTGLGIPSNPFAV